MEQNEKITFIKGLFEKNVHNISTPVEIRSEDQKKLFCLLVDNKIIGVLIKTSFINEKTTEEIEKHFNDISIYHFIENKGESNPLPKNDIVIWYDDPHCQELHRHQ